MKYTHYLALGLLTLTCAGCATAKPSNTATAPEVKSQPAVEAKAQPAAQPQTTATVVTPENVPIVPTSAKPVDIAPVTQTVASTMTFEIDETWQTYSNKSLSFEFKWPTRGTYAPHWSVDFRKTDDKQIEGGCVVDDNYVSNIKSDKFCHTTSLVVEGEHYQTDYYSIKRGNQYVVVTFTKDLFSTPDTCKKSGVTTSANSCKEFVPEDYQALLNTIMSTFKDTE